MSSKLRSDIDTLAQETVQMSNIAGTSPNNYATSEGCDTCDSLPDDADPTVVNCQSWDHLVNAVALRIRQSLKLGDILEYTVNEVHQLLGCDLVFIYRFNSDQSGQVVSEAVSASEWSIIDRAIHDLCVESNWLEPDQEQCYVAIEDVAAADLTPRHTEFLANFQVKAHLAIPILEENTFWGLLITHHCQDSRSWQAVEIEGLQLLAVQIGIAVHQASLVDQLQSANAKLEIATRDLAETNKQLREETQRCQQTTDELCQHQKQIQQLATIVKCEQEEHLHQGVEAALKDSQGLFQAFMSHAPALTWITSIDGVITYANPPWLTFVGQMAQSALGQSLETFFPAEVAQVFRQNNQRVVDTGEVLETVEYAPSVEGELRSFLVRKFPIYQNQQLLAVGGIGIDITARQQAKVQLQEQADLLRIFYKSSPLLMGVVETSDSDIFHTLHNSAAVAFFGVTPKSIDNRWASEIGATPEHIQLWLTRYRQSRETHKPVQFTYEHVASTQRKWLSVVVSFLGLAESGRPQFSYVVQDVTDRKQLVMERQRADVMQSKADRVGHELKLLENILEVILAGYWDWDIANNQEYLSPGFKHMFGYEDHELPNSPQTWQNLIYPEDLPGVLEQFERHVRSHGAEPYHNEVRYRHKDGSTVWVICSGQVIEWDDEGNPLRMIGCHIDITRRMQAEATLRESETRWQFAIEGAGDGLWDWNIQADQLFFSRQWKAMLGYENDEIGNGLDEWDSRLHPEDKARCHADLEQHFKNKSFICQSEYRIRCKDGSYKWILDRGKVLAWSDDGQPLRMIGTHTDISDRKQADLQLRTAKEQLSGILDSSLDGIMAFQSVRDDQGKIIDFEWLLSNLTACEIVGKSQEALIGHRMLTELPGNRDEGLFDIYVQVVETGEPTRQQFYYNHDGIDSWFENVVVKLGDGFAVTFRDITQIKRSEQEFQEVNQQLETHIDSLQKRNIEMQMLSRTSDFLQACRSIPEACTVISTLVKPLFPDCSGSIYITCASRNRLEQAAAWGEETGSLIDFAPHDCWGLRRGRLHLVPHHESGLRCTHSRAVSSEAETLCIPMIAQGETLGLFYLYAKRSDVLMESQQQLAQTVAEQVGLAIANLHLRETLQNQSIRDALTGLFNRRYLEESLRQEIARAQRKQTEIGVIMLDVDHFKRLNDTYGHEAGDLVLQAISKLLREQIRGADIACRYGGEELTLVLPDSGLQATQARADEIRVAISQLKLSLQGTVLSGLSASFGVAGFPQHGVNGAALLQAADAALYRSKSAGRNRVTVAP